MKQQKFKNKYVLGTGYPSFETGFDLWNSKYDNADIVELTIIKELARVNPVTPKYRLVLEKITTKRKTK